MIRRFLTRALFLFSLLISITAHASLFESQTTPKFAPVDQAFAFTHEQDGATLTLQWQVKSGYYLYRHQFKVTSDTVTVGSFELPHGEVYQDEMFGEVEALKGDLSVAVPLQHYQPGATVLVSYQGCAEAGFCYPPETRKITLTAFTSTSKTTAVNDARVTTPVKSTEETSESLPFSPLLALLFGIGVAFTPCVLPMYPLISGVILGNQRANTRRIFVLAFAYVQGMAITYTLLGIIVAAAGLKFQAAFQHPYLLIGLSVLFILLALSMFGLYSLQLPSALQTRLSAMSNHQKGGSVLGVVMMGAIAGVICSPCTTAPLSAILLYIAQSGNVAFGAGVLYLYALGMGIPLILFALFGHRLLPKAGMWMTYVKELFGFVILAMPIFLLERIIGDAWGIRLWSLLGVALFAWAFIVALNYKSGIARTLQILFLSAAIFSSQPVQSWLFGGESVTESVVKADANHFLPVNTLTEMQDQLAEAKGQYVMVDFYADWCVSCRELDKKTFPDAKVQAALASFTLLKADVTANNAEHEKLFTAYDIVGLPTVLFFDKQGNEVKSMRITGFKNADDFLVNLEKLPK